MRVNFKIKDFEIDCNDIVGLLYEKNALRPQKKISKFLNLNIECLHSIGKANGAIIVRKILKNDHDNNEKNIENKLLVTKKMWNSVEDNIFKILENIFEIKYNKKITANFSLNLVCPRYLETSTLDINYRESIDEIRTTCIHEIIHFFWFEKFTILFPDIKKVQYNANHLPWLLSEIEIDAIINNTDLKQYCNTARPAYDYFYDIIINGENMIEHFRNLFNDNNINDFIIKGLEYVTMFCDKINDMK